MIADVCWVIIFMYTHSYNILIWTLCQVLHSILLLMLSHFDATFICSFRRLWQSIQNSIRNLSYFHLKITSKGFSVLIRIVTARSYWSIHIKKGMIQQEIELLKIFLGDSTKRRNLKSKHWRLLNFSTLLFFTPLFYMWRKFYRKWQITQTTKAPMYWYNFVGSSDLCLFHRDAHGLLLFQ